MTIKRTNIYIDGFNLYYGCLKDTPYKWLDLKALFTLLLDKSQHEIKKIKYFTARVSSYNGDDRSHLRQKYYLQAIEQYLPELEIYYGHFLTHPVIAKVVSPPPNFIKIYKTEEKGSDVNLALHLLNDAWLDDFDCAILVSNDSDLAESLRLVKQHNKNIGLIFPNRDAARRPSRELSKYADFIKKIRVSHLERALLPTNIPGTKIFKPAEW